MGEEYDYLADPVTIGKIRDIVKKNRVPIERQMDKIANAISTQMVPSAHLEIIRKILAEELSAIVDNAFGFTVVDY
jgi:hypothetical protein